ncbi:SPOR domain-containing protein [Pedobacter frigiditerrae]|uniref:SPOR domain-containing protein n=1 Tax=Pedobacter frigiditerrae TaxID=2530452 RepID=A0A4V2MJ87_9SPHI|nr:SPOR domain-containing protein [Pedobacter frigiditerrae]TCC93346.1 SPOR domain-containing protein [Pedobacter frigiditerrae]
MMRIFLSILFLFCFQQSFAQTKGEVTVIKDPLIDSLIAKRIELNIKRPSATNPTTPVIFNGMGYRVQVFYGSDRREAFNEQSKFRALYPKIMTYISYKEPNYYLRVGDFRTRMEAQKLLTELRANFPTLFIFREKINAPDLEETNK